MATTKTLTQYGILKNCVRFASAKKPGVTLAGEPAATGEGFKAAANSANPVGAGTQQMKDAAEESGNIPVVEKLKHVAENAQDKVKEAASAVKDTISSTFGIGTEQTKSKYGGQGYVSPQKRERFNRNPPGP